MKKLFFLLFITTSLMAQSLGQNSYFKKDLWKLLNSTTLSPVSSTYGTSALFSSLTDGTDTYKMLTSSDKWTLQNDAVSPANIVTIDSAGNAIAKSLALGGATLGANGLAVTGTAAISGNVYLGTGTPETGYKLDVTGYINSRSTASQTTYPQVYLDQTPSVLQDGGSYTGTDATLTTNYIAFKFTAATTMNAGDIQLKVKESADITNKGVWVTGYLYSDDGGSPSKPNALLYTGGDWTYGVFTSSYQVIPLPLYYTLTSGVTYWFVIFPNEAPVGGNIIFDSDVSTNAGATSSDGSTWTNTDVRPRHFIRGRTAQAIYANNGGSTGAGILAYSKGGYGIGGKSASSYGVNAESDYFPGLRATSTYRQGAEISSTYFHALGLSVNPSSTNTSDAVLRLTRTTSGTAANGIGGGIDWYIENANGSSPEQTATISALLTNATNDAESSAITFGTRSGGGAVTERMRITDDGKIVVDSLISHNEVSSLADSASITIATGVAGWGEVMIGDNQEWAHFRFTSAGVVTLITNSTNVATDGTTDSKLQIYDGGSGIIIKNLLGSRLKCAVKINYYTP